MALLLCFALCSALLCVGCFSHLIQMCVAAVKTMTFGSVRLQCSQARFCTTVSPTALTNALGCVCSNDYFGAMQDRFGDDHLDVAQLPVLAPLSHVMVCVDVPLHRYCTAPCLLPSFPLSFLSLGAVVLMCCCGVCVLSALLNASANPSMYHIFYRLIEMPSFWLYILIAPTVCLLPDLIIKSYATPTLSLHSHLHLRFVCLPLRMLC